jgi:AcrR family transcriptional regulator
MNAPFTKPALAIIEAAERLIAERGLGVPLSLIGQEAGAANKVAVQYHFGDRERLIDAVFRYRLPLLEGRRATLLAEADEQDPKALLAALLRPIAEVVDAAGRRSFAGFLYQITANARATRAGFDALAPFASYLVGRLRQSLPHMSQTRFHRRLGSASLVYLDWLVQADAEEAVDEALGLAGAVLTAA